jgi:hypothetical protein
VCNDNTIEPGPQAHQVFGRAFHTAILGAGGQMFERSPEHVHRRVHANQRRVGVTPAMQKTGCVGRRRPKLRTPETKKPAKRWQMVVRMRRTMQRFRDLQRGGMRWWRSLRTRRSGMAPRQ